MNSMSLMINSRTIAMKNLGVRSKSRNMSENARSPGADLNEDEIPEPLKRNGKD